MILKILLIMKCILKRIAREELSQEETRSEGQDAEDNLL